MFSTETMITKLNRNEKHTFFPTLLLLLPVIVGSLVDRGWMSPRYAHMDGQIVITVMIQMTNY